VGKEHRTGVALFQREGREAIRKASRTQRGKKQTRTDRMNQEQDSRLGII